MPIKFKSLAHLLPRQALFVFAPQLFPFLKSMGGIRPLYWIIADNDG
ncbi:unnamed protein product [Ciceribacter selenitireducens ATCC BAA-1503]|uniref:Uncharacterized protein n=1 Tax=Ciceribacter selenitireducens ATCC BAA-1503 TaxID=1336235 RepID=A0A376AEI2_9HYPH|nr:unnamed protein product [Ciceribacter selenitireducens ATCC BAA-1503]